MAQILVRKLDDDVLSKIKGRAKKNRRSAEAEVREILTQAVKTARPKHVPLTELVGAAPTRRTTEEIVAYVRALRDEWER
jgi:plasmid stability protein